MVLRAATEPVNRHPIASLTRFLAPLAPTLSCALSRNAILCASSLQVVLIFLSTNSDAAHAANESSADFDATWAEKRGALDSTPIKEILMIGPRLLSLIFGRNPMI